MDREFIKYKYQCSTGPKGVPAAAGSAAAGKRCEMEMDIRAEMKMDIRAG
jgi:hypothetical protein